MSARSALRLLHRHYGTGTVTNSNPVLLRHRVLDREVHLIGTVHVSTASADAVRELIRVVRPSEVHIELDKDRAAKLMRGSSPDKHDLAGSIAAAAAGLLRNPATGLAQLPGKIVGSLIQRVFQGAAQVGLTPGAEFIAAIEEAESMGAKIVMMDRNANETLQRLGAAVLSDLPGWIRLAMGGPNSNAIPEEITKLARATGMRDAANVLAHMRRDEIRSLTHWLRRQSPRAMEAMLDERDLIMTESLRATSGNTCTKIVGVVGRAHMDGIERLWTLSDGQFEDAKRRLGFIGQQTK